MKFKIYDIMVSSHAAEKFGVDDATLRTYLHSSNKKFDDAIRKGLVIKSGPFAVHSTDEQMRDPDYLRENKGTWLFTAEGMEFVFGDLVDRKIKKSKSESRVIELKVDNKPVQVTITQSGDGYLVSIPEYNFSFVLQDDKEHPSWDKYLPESLWTELIKMDFKKIFSKG